MCIACVITQTDHNMNTDSACSLTVYCSTFDSLHTGKSLPGTNSQGKC